MLDNGSLKVLEGLIDYLSEKPELFDLLNYLSKFLCREGHICGVTLGMLDHNNQIKSAQRIGFEIDPEEEITVSIDSNFPAAVSLRNQEMIILDLESPDSVQNEVTNLLRATEFRSCCFIPLNNRTLIILTFINSYEITMSRQTFLECIRSVLKMFMTYQSRNYIDENEWLRTLTPRQELISSAILAGLTNHQIAAELSYSVSLIRQETMRIYSKMGVDGRSELRRKLAKEVKANSSQDQ